MKTKVYDAAVKVGEYTNEHGEVKGRYVDVGAIMKGEDGSHFMLMPRTFNPAGVPNPKGQENMIISLFTPKPKMENGQ